jgi:formylglycine-generating enzyme required for sulfatase activity
MRLPSSIPAAAIAACLFATAATAEQVGPRLDIGFGRAYRVQTETNHTYQLQGRDSLATNAWYGMGDAIVGTGSIEFGFERGEGPSFLPARRWQWATNTDGWSLSFDGVDDFAFVPHDARLNLTNGMTLEAWIKPARTGACTFIAKASSPSVVCYSLGLTAQNRGLFRVFDSSGGAFVSVTGATALATGQWRHVAAAWSGAQAKLMLDGALDASMSTSGVTRVSAISVFQVGSILGSEAFRGSLDQARVWGAARSEVEVQGDYQSAVAGDTAGLVGLWRLSEGVGQIAADSTANALDLNLGADAAADAGDPSWEPGSFPPASSYGEIFSFGERCLVVGHLSETGATCRLDSATALSPGDWSQRGSETTVSLQRVDYLVWPTNSLEAFRAWGAPETMVPVPAGSFAMGNATNLFPEGGSEELPQHQVFVSAFYMERHEVTKGLWDEIQSWAATNGYAFENPGAGKAVDHPVHTVSWYDAVKWCNARSERQGLTACYTTNGAVYKAGNNSNVVCNWSANGYRLPTEAEWEKAARGGLAGTRFPWDDFTNKISHAKANYEGSASYTYDLSRGFHPGYTNGAIPYTSPVGSFAPNGYGLYDMVGNLFEMVWDWYSPTYYTVAPSNDPTGPATGSLRAGRGGSWTAVTSYSRIATRGGSTPTYEGNGNGFRCVRRQ